MITKNMDNEATCFNNDFAQSTVVPDYSKVCGNADDSQSPTNATGSPCATVSTPDSRKANLIKRAAVGLGAGLVIGGVAAAVMSMKSSDDDQAPASSGRANTNSENHQQAAEDANTTANTTVTVNEPASGDVSNPTTGNYGAVGQQPSAPQQSAGGEDFASAYTDGQIGVASGVDDSMSFATAFATARNEVGPGGVFEWRGQLYGTYNADEWNGMSASERAEWADHFNWDNIDQPQHDPVYATNDQPQVEQPAVEQPVVEQPVAIDDDIHVVETEPGTGNRPFAMNEDSEVEVIGVVHNDELDMNVANITVDGQEAILVDVNGDMQFDYITADFDGDGNISTDERLYYDGDGPTVSDAGGFTDGYDPAIEEIAASDDEDIYIDNSDQIYDDI